MLDSKTRNHYLKHLNVGDSIWAIAAAIHFNVFKPLDVGLGITVYLAEELNITAHHSCGVGGQPSLQDRPVRRSLCQEKSGESLAQDSWRGQMPVKEHNCAV